MLDSPLIQPLSRSSLVFLLVLDPQLHTPYISSPNHHQSSSSFRSTCSMFCCNTNAMSSIPSLSLSSLLGSLSFSLTPHHSHSQYTKILITLLRADNMAWPGAGLFCRSCSVWLTHPSCMSRMLVVRHPINSFDAYWYYPRRALSGLYRCPEFGWMSVCSKNRAEERWTDGR